MKITTFIILSFLFFSSAYAEIKESLVSVGYTSDLISGCSGSFVAFEDYRSSHKGLYMTNGHCTKLNNYLGVFLEPEEVIKNLPHRTTVKIFQNSEGLFKRQKVARIKTSKVLFATMTVRDVAIYELDLSYEQIYEQFGIDPLILKKSSSLLSGTELAVVSGYWKEDYLCEFSGFSDGLVHSGPFFWEDTLVLNQCDPNVKGGVSGSPALIRGTRFVVGLHNSSDKGTKKPCSLHSACEKDFEGNIISQKGDAFSQNIDFLFDCRDENGQFDALASTCPF